MKSLPRARARRSEIDVDVSGVIVSGGGLEN